MKKTITKSNFIDEFARMGRTANFTIESREVLFDYLEETSPDYELDIIELCCSFSEYALDEALDEFGAEDFDDLCRNNLVIRVNDDIVIIGH